MSARTAIFVGDVSWDTTVKASRMPHADEKIVAEQCVEGVGGVVANAAIACSLAGGQAILFATVGADVSGTAVQVALAQFRIEARLSSSEGSTTTRAIIFLDDHGEKRLFLVPGSRMFPNADTVAAIAFDRAGWVHTALYDLEQSARLIAHAREASVPWSIDLEPATIPGDVNRLATHISGCQTVMINERAQEQLGDDAVQLLLEMGAKEVVETLGPRGVRLHSRNFALEIKPGELRKPVIDTTGAGDAFAGWFVAERMSGSSLEVALTRAVHAASQSVTALGASASYKERAGVLASI